MSAQLMRVLLLGGIACLLIFSGCSPAKDEPSEPKDPNRVQVYTTLYPLQFFAEKIGGEHVQVTNLIPTGTEPHDFEPSAKVLAKLTEADIFIYNGAGMEPWVEKVENAIDEQKTQKLDASGQIKPLDIGKQEVENEHGHEDEHEHEQEEKAAEQEHDHGEFDPHVWLDPMLAKKQALAIKNAFVKQDPTHQSVYEQNYQQLVNELDKLDQEFADMVKQAKKKQFVTSHDAFSYLAHHYGLEQIAVTGLSPSDEPSAKELERIVETIKKHQLKYIFFETLVSPSVAKTVQAEAKVEALVLHPLEGLTKEELSSGQDYFSLMRMNKENLAKALESK